MTAQIHAFPAAPDRRADIVTAARAILRSPAPHDRETIREACHAMMTWGNAVDWSEAYPVLRALDLPKPATVQLPYSASVDVIRAVLCAMIAVPIVWLGLAGVMSW